MFHVSLLEQDTTRKKRVEKVPELDASNGDNEEYKIEVIWDNAVYIEELEAHLLGLYYLIA